jgi:hypothetical protein
MTVIIRALQQETARKNITELQVDIDWRKGIGQQLLRSCF